MVASLTAELLFCLGTLTLASPLVWSGSNQSIQKEISRRIFIGRTDAEAETPILWPPDVTHWKRPWCWERSNVGAEGDDRGWDAWMASLTQWTWVWVGSGSWWWTGKPGVLQSMGSQRVKHDWVNWTESSGWKVSPQNFSFSSLRFLIRCHLLKRSFLITWSTITSCSHSVTDFSSGLIS